ncbi:hypothetical protein STTU_1012 [Streptomyces sp. Tu6071]|nr:hypothetical protein STTU_1012 [Streptomyces sp. Tu6071]
MLTPAGPSRSALARTSTRSRGSSARDLLGDFYETYCARARLKNRGQSGQRTDRRSRRFALCSDHPTARRRGTPAPGEQPRLRLRELRHVPAKRGSTGGCGDSDDTGAGSMRARSLRVGEAAGRRGCSRVRRR